MVVSPQTVAHTMSHVTSLFLPQGELQTWMGASQTEGMNTVWWNM